MAVTEIREYDYDARLVTIRDLTGMVTGKRAFNAEETAEADLRVTLTTNETSLNNDAKTAIVTLQQSISTLKSITDKVNADIGPADTKQLARELTTVARQLLRLTRIRFKAFDSAAT